MEGISDYNKAGDIATQVLKNVRKKVKPGAKVIEIADWVEEEIVNLGGGIAFPCSVAVNEYAAHYAPLYNDKSVIPENSITKVDLGVHINGYICDCATTVNLNDELSYLEKASKEALKAGVESIRAGITVSEISSAIFEAIERNNAKNNNYNHNTFHLTDILFK